MTKTNNSKDLSVINNRIILYWEFFSQFLLLLQEKKEIIKKDEENIKYLGFDILKKIKNLNFKKYDDKLFDDLIKEIKEFKIELQIAALNAKIKSLEMKDFSNIISVIGKRLEEEAIKVELSFVEIRKTFNLIFNNLEKLKKELELINDRNKEVSYYDDINEVENFLNDNLIILFNDKKGKINNKEISVIQNKLISFSEKLKNINLKISKMKTTKYSLDVKKIYQEIVIYLKKVTFFIKDYLNFVFKVNYLTFITKTEVGKLNTDNFIMVILTLEKLSQRANEIKKTLNNIYNFFDNLAESFYRYFLAYSKDMKKLIFKNYVVHLIDLEEEIEAMRKFIEKDIELLSSIIDKNKI